MDTTSPEPAIPQPGSTLSYMPVPHSQGVPYALYSPQGVGLATFFGSPIAGAIILALNYRRLGKSSAAVKAILLGLLGTAALIGLGFLLPSGMPSTAIAVGGIVAMVQLAKQLQGPALDLHKNAGGKIGSLWQATAIGILGLFLVGSVIVAIVFLTSPFNSKTLKVGISEIRYSGSVTEPQAQALGKALTDAGYFGTDHPATVLLARDNSGATLTFVVDKDAAEKQSTLDVLTSITEQLAPSIGGKPILLKLDDSGLNELKSKKIE